MSWFRKRKKPNLVDATGALLKACRDEWGSNAANATYQAFEEAVRRTLDLEQLGSAARLVADALATWPDPESGQVALILGSLVEAGAPPRPHFAPLLARLATVTSRSARFIAALDETLATKTEKVSSADERAILERALTQVAQEQPHGEASIAAFSGFALAAIAHLARDPNCRAMVRLQPGLLESARRLANAKYPPGSASFLAKMVHVLDGELLLVFAPDAGRGFEVELCGIADNFQLHTLLGAELVPRGVEGRLPSAEQIANARGTGPQGLKAPSHGVFNLLQWTALSSPALPLKESDSKHWIWNEGVPADILLFAGRRITIIGPAPYPRSWNTARQFGPMAAGAKVIRELGLDEVRTWTDKLAQAPLPTEPRVMHGGP